MELYVWLKMAVTTMVENVKHYSSVNEIGVDAWPTPLALSEQTKLESYLQKLTFPLYSFL